MLSQWDNFDAAQLRTILHWQSAEEALHQCCPSGTTSMQRFSGRWTNGKSTKEALHQSCPSGTTLVQRFFGE